MTEMDMRDAWNRTGPTYQAVHRIPTDSAHYGPFCPTESELNLLGDVRGKRILELGCGGGQCSIAFARQGAIATGIDLSDAQIAFARDLAARHRVHVAFHQGNAESIPMIQDQSQDIVFSAYALQYVRDLDACLAEVARVLVAGGLFVCSLDHPFRDCFWDQTEDEDTLYPAYSYFQRGAMDWTFMETGVRMRSYHRTVGDWVDALHRAGLRVERILEPGPVGVDESTWREHYPIENVRRIPQTIIFVARKAG